MSEEDPLVAQCQTRIGALLSGKWRLEFLIGVGGMAAVYAATHRNGARAAIKILHPEFAGHQEVRARFLREAYIANKVDHPGTVQVLDDDIAENGEPYLVMELLAGESVESRAQRNGGWLHYHDVLSITEQTLAVLEKAHAAGVIHRDLKPDNLFLTTKRQVKVLDFGIARLHDAAGSKRTQTGMMMGTPAYMAPEQALGRWAQVDGRTDLWSVGGIMFSLLSGRPVHGDAGTDNEMLIHAATRPAPSLARVVRGAPLDLVRVVDRALSYEQANRYPDAAAMRADIRALMQQAGVLSATDSPPGPAPAGAPHVATQVQPIGMAAPVAQPPPQALRAPAEGAAPTVAHAPAASAGAPAVAAAAQATSAPIQPARTQIRPTDERNRDVDAFDAAYATDEDVEAMHELFIEVERALIARVQYGDHHPETKRRADRAFRVCASALMHAEYGLVWNVTPYSFVAKEKTLWEPSSPFDRVPYQLFSDGIRLLGVTAGLDENEFSELFRILTLDRLTDLAPEDDFVTLLWDADFKHVVYQAIDAFAEGDHQQRLGYEKARNDIVELARADTSGQLEQSWQARQAQKQSSGMSAKQAEIVNFLRTGEPIDLEAAARAAALDAAQGRIGPAPIEPSVLMVDDALRTMLAARLTMDTAGMSERFVVSSARAFEDAMMRGSHTGVTMPLRFAIDGLSKNDPELAIDIVGALCREVGLGFQPADAERLRATLAGGIVSPAMIAAVLVGATSEGANQAVYATGLKTILGYVDDTHFVGVLKAVGAIVDPELRDVLVAYMQRTGQGHEAEMGELFAEADVDLGLALVRVLAGMRTPGAREAISMAVKCPHPVVRIEALGHVEGVSSERLRLELRALLEDREPDVRIAALKAMEQYAIRVAGPFLVLRVKAPQFDSLPPAERRQAFQTLVALAPTRAEAAAVDVLKEGRVVSTDAHEESRAIAAETLARVATTAEALAALTEFSTARWKNSDRVRAAAQKALDELGERAARAEGAAQAAEARARSPR